MQIDLCLWLAVHLQVDTFNPIITKTLHFPLHSLTVHFQTTIDSRRCGQDIIAFTFVHCGPSTDAVGALIK